MLGFNGTDSQVLSDLKELNVEFKMFIDWNQSGVIYHRCANTLCGNNSINIDYGYAVLGLIFSNYQFSQTLFYQIVLYDTRDNLIDCKTGGNTCQMLHSWYFKTNPFGLSDSLPMYQYPCISDINNHSLHFNTNILDKIKYSLNQSDPTMPPTVNSNITNWRLTSMYIGGGVQGQTSLTLLVNDIKIQSS